jgi:hypothetical protein
VVLGHSDPYPRFGFLPAARFGTGCEYGVPVTAFNTYERAADQPMKRPKGAARNTFSKGENPQAQPEGPRFPGNSPCASR